MCNDNNEKRYNFQVDRTVPSKTRFASVDFCVVNYYQILLTL